MRHTALHFTLAHPKPYQKDKSWQHVASFNPAPFNNLVLLEKGRYLAASIGHIFTNGVRINTGMSATKHAIWI